MKVTYQLHFGVDCMVQVLSQTLNEQYRTQQLVVGSHESLFVLHCKFKTPVLTSRKLACSTTFEASETLPTRRDNPTAMPRR